MCCVFVNHQDSQQSTKCCQPGPVILDQFSDLLRKVKQKQVGQSRRSVVQLLFHMLPKLVHAMPPLKKCSGITLKY